MSWYMWVLLFFVLLSGAYLLIRLAYRKTIQRGEFCPRCGGAKFHRVRRNTADRIFGIGLQTRRFRCANPNCKWEGMRQYYPRPKSWNKSAHHSHRSENKPEDRSENRSSTSSTSNLSEN
jgi:hypothetical protein